MVGSGGGEGARKEGEGAFDPDADQHFVPRRVDPFVCALAAQGVEVFVEGALDVDEGTLAGAVEEVLEGGDGDEVAFHL